MNDDIRNRFKGMSKYPSRPAAPARPVSRDFVVGPPKKPTPPTQPAQPKPAVKKQPDPKAKTPKKPGSKKWLKRLVVLVLLVSAAVLAFWFIKNRERPVEQPEQTNNSTQQPEAPAGPTGTIKLLATGEFTAYDSIHSAAKKANGYDYMPMVETLKPIFAKSDINLCSFGSPAGGAGRGITGYPDFNGPAEWADMLDKLGCNLIDLSSNHTNDKGQAAINEHVKYWDAKENILAAAGANRSAEEQKTIRYFSLKGLDFAFLSYVVASQKPLEQPHGLNIYNEAQAKAEIAEARKKAKFIIVSMNWGKEDSAGLTAEQPQIAQVLANAGVDLVVGNGAHIVQPAKVLDGQDGHQTLVWYGLGNMVNSQLPIDNLIGGIAVVNIDVATGNILDPGILPVYMHYEWTAAQKAANDFNARKNFGLYALDQAASFLAKSLNNTTVEAQTKRIETTITSQDAPIKVYKSTDIAND